MAMLPRAEFAPELVTTMRTVLDAAIGQIDEMNRTPATKAKMAEYILRCASEGITDAQHLTDVAVEAGRERAA